MTFLPCLEVSESLPSAWSILILSLDNWPLSEASTHTPCLPAGLAVSLERTAASGSRALHFSSSVWNAVAPLIHPCLSPGASEAGASLPASTAMAVAFGDQGWWGRVQLGPVQ